MNKPELTTLQKALGYKFKNFELLEAALTHSSYSNENKGSGVESNERLEFLGDSVLGMTVAVLIYSGMPSMPEGQMTRLRAELVCEKSLAALAGKLKLGQYLLLGRGEDRNGGRMRPSILADALEAVLAAMYLDGGFKPIEKFVSVNLLPKKGPEAIESSDYKTALQEAVQEKVGQVLSYHTTGESGPDHKKVFMVEVMLNGKSIGSGKGGSKKEAEQAAARSALELKTGKE